MIFTPSTCFLPQAPICRFHSLCHDLSSMRMHAVERERIYSLEDFIQAHEDHRKVGEGRTLFGLPSPSPNELDEDE